MNLYQITQWSHELFRLQVQEGGIYIDATMGKGRDTSFLCELAKETGKVLAFDIQEAALSATDRLLREQGVRNRAELYRDSHVHMDRYLPPESADGIYFNFGYLPGGDHSLATRGETSVKAMDVGLSLLKKKGVMALCIYSGGDSGFEEKDAVLSWLSGLDPRKYLVIRSDYYNRPHNPPIPVLIIRL